MNEKEFKEKVNKEIEKARNMATHQENTPEWEKEIEEIGIASFGGIAFEPSPEYREKILKILKSLLDTQREEIVKEVAEEKRLTLSRGEEMSDDEVWNQALDTVIEKIKNK